MASSLPDYVASAQPLSKDNRVGWFSNVGPTYAGIMLWFVFWHDVPVGAGIHPDHGQYSAVAGGSLAQGLGVALVDPFTLSSDDRRGYVLRRFEPQILMDIVIITVRGRPISTIGRQFLDQVSTSMSRLALPAAQLHIG